MVECEEVRKLLVAYYDDSLPVEATTDCKKHLDACESCRAESVMIQATLEALRQSSDVFDEIVAESTDQKRAEELWLAFQKRSKEEPDWTPLVLDDLKQWSALQKQEIADWLRTTITAFSQFPTLVPQAMTRATSSEKPQTIEAEVFDESGEHIDTLKLSSRAAGEIDDEGHLVFQLHATSRYVNWIATVSLDLLDRGTFTICHVPVAPDRSITVSSDLAELGLDPGTLIPHDMVSVALRPPPRTETA